MISLVAGGDRSDDADLLAAFRADVGSDPGVDDPAGFDDRQGVPALRMPRSGASSTLGTDGRRRAGAGPGARQPDPSRRVPLLVDADRPVGWLSSPSSSGSTTAPSVGTWPSWSTRSGDRGTGTAVRAGRPRLEYTVAPTTESRWGAIGSTRCSRRCSPRSSAAVTPEVGGGTAGGDGPGTRVADGRGRRRDDGPARPDEPTGLLAAARCGCTATPSDHRPGCPLAPRERECSPTPDTICRCTSGWPGRGSRGRGLTIEELVTKDRAGRTAA